MATGKELKIMPKQRDKVKMTPAEIERLFNECKSLNVATLDKSGAPHLTTLWFAYHNGRVMFETYGKSQKIINLRRDPRIAAICEAGTAYNELRGVSIQGRAEIIDQGPDFIPFMCVLVARNHPGLGREGTLALAEKMAEKRVVVVIHADKVLSWDHRKLAA